MKRKYTLHVQSARSINQNSKAESVVARKHTNLKMNNKPPSRWQRMLILVDIIGCRGEFYCLLCEE